VEPIKDRQRFALTLAAFLDHTPIFRDGVGDKNVGVELDGVRHDAGGLSLISLDYNRLPIAHPAPAIVAF